MTTEQFLRDAEVKVLDVHHTTLPLWKHDHLKATFSCLVQYDCFAILAIMGPPQVSGIGHLQLLKGFDEGLAQAIQWLHDGKSRVDLIPSSDRDLIGEAGLFCRHASTYVDVADFHKMYGRKQVTIEFDEAARRIRFVRLHGSSPATGLLGMAEHTNRLNKIMKTPDAKTARRLAEAAQNKLSAAPIRYDGSLIGLEDVRIANDTDVKSIFALAMPTEPILLEDLDDLGGFNVAEFRDFFQALQRWSFCCGHFFLESLMKRGKQQWECIPTQHVLRAEFLSKMTELSDLPIDKVSAITDRLTYDNRTKSPQVFQQPLFCGPDYVTWSVSVIQNSKFLRNMLKLMSRTKATEKYAATLIGSRERAMLRELGALLSRRGKCSFNLTAELSLGGEDAEVDLLAYNPKFPDEVLIVEAKAVLGVDEINEVDSATTEMISGQNQLAKRIAMLEAMPLEQKQGLFKFVNWNVSPKIFGVVIAADAEPNNRYDQAIFPGISLQTIKDRLRDNHFGSPLKFWKACRDRHWLTHLSEYEETYRPIKIGDVTYEIPALRRRKETSGDSTQF